MNNPQVLFEVSWEVGNMVGGIHTVLASKAWKMQEFYGDQYIAVGPDLPRTGTPSFREEIWHPGLHEALAELPVGCRMGRWLVPGEPRCLLVNAAGLQSAKDQILADYWDRYRLDSLFGGWDYVEPLLFSHAAGMVIELMASRFLRPKRMDVVVQCHEWMACGAILHLRKAAPEIGTVFTTHATVLGRSLSSNRGAAAHAQLSEPPGPVARELGVGAKHSMELVAARLADCFTTVSPITAEECVAFLGRRPDPLLPNALGNEFPSPEHATPEAARKSRLRLLKLAQGVTGVPYDRDRTLVLFSGGRYEFVNKGVDLLLEALGRLAAAPREHADRRVLAFLAFPAGHGEPWPAGAPRGEGGEWTTHVLKDPAGDPILSRLRSLQLTNRPDSPVHVVFAPIYLNGSDPLIPETYYQLLAGTDLTVFPSLYEPWGYTPMESVGYGVPTITTDCTGFGLWVSSLGTWDDCGAYVLPRKGRSSAEVSEDLAARLSQFAALPEAKRKLLQRAARKASQQMRWQHFGRDYFKAHRLALSRAMERVPSAGRPEASASPLAPSRARAVEAHLHSILVLNDIPREVEPLREMGYNLAWSWHPEAPALFSELDRGLWEACGGNPIVFLESVNSERLALAARSPDYRSRLKRVVTELDALRKRGAPQIAYFSPEFGLLGCLKQYAGGLGILAGDHLKAASDARVPLCAVGLAYRNGYLRQRITRDGIQMSIPDRDDFRTAPMTPVVDAHGAPLRVAVPFPSGPVQVHAWAVRVGGVDLYLLDTDSDANGQADRAVLDRLYGGDRLTRLRQELILGVGGFAFLQALGLDPAVYHMNEGHSAFLVLSRMSHLMRTKGLKRDEALEYVRRTTVFTTHTPVAAGHDAFPDEMARPYLAPFQEPLQKDWPELLRMGQPPVEAKRAEFSTTYLALNGSARVNAVSAIHAGVSRRMFRDSFPGLHESEVPVIHVTNGVHAQTWLAPEWQSLFESRLGKDWRSRLADAKYWERVRGLGNAQVWRTHLVLKRRLIAWLREHLRETWSRRGERPADLATALRRLQEGALFVGFARRFAEYKRANLLFHDMKRLESLCRDERPMVVLFAGKAHPSDGAGQGLIRRILEVSRMPQFLGRILFVEDYDMDKAKRLVSGCDVWLNNPMRPMEACGTSGMKAAMNGCLNASVGDGWWVEGYDGGNGWMIGSEGAVGDVQDEMDAAQIYDLLAHDVLPRFHARDRAGIPRAWVGMMKASMASVIPRFSASRMVGEYLERAYLPALEEGRRLAADDFAALSARVRRLRHLFDHWEAIDFVDVRVEEGMAGEKVRVGRPVEIRVSLNHPRLSSGDIEVQAMLGRVSADGGVERFRVHPLQREAAEGQEGASAWRASIVPVISGRYAVGLRVVPSAPPGVPAGEAPMTLVKWL